MTPLDTREKSVTRILAAQAGDEKLTEELLLENAPLIWSIVRRFYGRGADPDDLFQLGCIGFIKAVRGFDASFGTQFSTYAVPQIIGEIKRFLRDDSMIKVSRSLKENAAKIYAVKQRIETREGREAHLSELSEELGLSLSEIASCEAASAATFSLDAAIGDEGFTLSEVVGSSGQEEKLVESIALREAVDLLPENERSVLLLRFFRDMTQQKTAEALGVSQVQVSRLERRAILRIRKLLTE